MTFPTEARIVIVGGGVFGASAAFHLAGEGHRNIVLLDQGPLASGTTPFAAGQTAYLNSMTGTKSGLPLANYCLEFFENFAAKTGYPVNFHQNGSLRIALSDPYVRDLEEHVSKAKELGFRMEWLNPAEAKRMVPALEVPQAKGIIFIPRDGFVDPKAVAVAYAAAARDLGVNIRTHTRVNGLAIAQNEVKAVRTDRGTIRAEWVVVAAGAWTRQFAQRLGVDIKAVPVRHQSFITAPMANILSEQPVVRLIEPQVYARPEKGGMLVGGYGHRQISFNMDDFPSDFRIPALASDQIYYHRLRVAATTYFPSLREALIVQEQAGLPTMTPDATYIVSKVPEAKGLIFAAGCQVGGISISPAIGRLVADLVADRESLVSLSRFEANRFGAEYADEAHLRSACEEIYGRLYLQLR